MLHYVRRGRWRDTAEGRAFSPCFCCGFLFSSFLLEGIQWHIHSPIMLRTDPSLVTTLLQSVLCRNHWQLISSTSCTNIHQLVPWEGISAQKLWTSSGWGKSIFFFLPSNGEQPHFSNEIWIQTLWTRSFFLCLFLPCILSLIPKVFFRVLFIPLQSLPSYK